MSSTLRPWLTRSLRLLLDLYKIPTGVSLAVVAAIITVAVTASWRRIRTTIETLD